jgi:cellobiose phosphorylase
MGDGDQAEALFRLLNPIYHGDTPQKIARYRVEPYVIAADVYGAPPQTGRGGWTWYTGSSGWMYRLGIEAILGVRREGDHLHIDPRIPKEWQYYELSYRYKEAVYTVKVDISNNLKKGLKEVLLDGQLMADGRIPLSNEKREYQVLVRLG